jgi:hypothetical protein
VRERADVEVDGVETVLDEACTEFGGPRYTKMVTQSRHREGEG